MFARGPLWVIVIAFGIVAVWAVFDAALRPAAAYDVIGHKKLYWVVGLALAIPFLVVPLVWLASVVGSIVYLVEYRPKLRQISRGSRDW